MRSSPSWDMEMKGRRMPMVNVANPKMARTAALRLLWILCQRGLRDVPQWGQEGRKSLEEGGAKDLPQRRQVMVLSVVSGPLSVAEAALSIVHPRVQPLIAPKAAKQLFLWSNSI